MKESPTPPVSSSGDDCTTDGSAVPTASPSNPTSASTSKALVPAGPVVAPAPSASCPASEDAPAATCCGEVQAESSSGGDENDDVSSYMQGEVRLVVTFEDGSFRRFSKSVVEDFRKLLVSGCLVLVGGCSGWQQRAAWSTRTHTVVCRASCA